ncbi:MAG: HAD family hydrolase [Chloroflexi bacterium]|nr:MAG: HAD family hydrolase [Chloroflexota bacterium]
MRAVFLDRDGVICRNRSDHVKSWTEFEFLPGALESLALLAYLGWPVVVVTNQAAVHRNLVSEEAVQEIHRRMVAEVTAAGGRIDRVLYCPHRPDEACFCRKPEPGMLVQAAQEMGLTLAGSYLVGDAASDMLAARRVGCRPFLVLTGRGMHQLLPALQMAGGQFTTVRNLKSAVAHILQAETCLPMAAGRLENHHLAE